MADTRHENETFGPDPMFLDGKIFVGCRFNQTKLIYTGEGDVAFNNCSLNNVNFQFQGAADRTLKLLHIFFQHPQTRPFVDGILAKVRSAPEDLGGGLPPIPASGPWQA